MATIDNKRDMYALYEAGKFGNRIQTWPSLRHFWVDDAFHPWTKNVVLRYKQPNSGFCVFDLPVSEINQTIERWVAKGANPELIAISEAIPKEIVMLNAEVQRSHNYYDLRYSTEPNHMRPALMKSQQHAGGVKALNIIKSHMDTASYELLNDLLDEYPDSVIEFTCFSAYVGVIPGRNCILWEVRNY